MPGDGLLLEALHHIGQTVAGGIQIRMVNLMRVSQQHNLAALPYPRDNGFHLVAGEILGFIDDNKLARDGPAADIGQGLHLNTAQSGQHLVDVPRLLGIEEILQIIIDRLHPRAELLILFPGQIADILAHWNHRAGNQQLLVLMIILHLH
ncbi:hypothetical protein D3C75_687110 [compost metagenome]